MRIDYNKINSASPKERIFVYTHENVGICTEYVPINPHEILRTFTNKTISFGRFLVNIDILDEYVYNNGAHSFSREKLNLIFKE